MDVYSGKAKDIVKLEKNRVKVVFRNSISAFDGEKMDELEGKGVVNCKTSTKLFNILEQHKIPTHYIENASDNELICEHVSIIPVEVVCRNIAAGSFCKRYGLESGLVLDPPVIEFFYKSDPLHDPLVTKEVAIQMGWASVENIMLMETLTRTVNHILRKVFDLCSLTLVDFKLEFGLNNDEQLLVADEISADTMRLWEKETKEIMDKDRFRKNMGDVISHFKDIDNRLAKLEDIPLVPFNVIAEISIDLKDSVLDPAGEITERTLKRQNFEGIELVRLGKKAKLVFSLPASTDLNVSIKKISESILSNPLIENYTFNLKFQPL